MILLTRKPGDDGGLLPAAELFFSLVGQVSVVIVWECTICSGRSGLFCRCGAVGRDKSADSNGGRVWRHEDTVHCGFVGAGEQ